MSEEARAFERLYTMFRDFWRARETILANLHAAMGASFTRLTAEPGRESQLGKLCDAISETISTFGKLVHEIGEYREAPEVYNVLKDDIERAVAISRDIREQAIRAATMGSISPTLLDNLRAKLREVSDKFDKHMKLKRSDA